MRDFYRLCRQTVTVYRAENGGFTRTVYRNAWFRLRRVRSEAVNRNRTVEAIGGRDSGQALVVIPGDVQAVFPGDKVLLGAGPEIGSAAAWAAFIPAKVPNLAVITWAEPMYYDGRIVHTEAG